VVITFKEYLIERLSASVFKAMNRVAADRSRFKDCSGQCGPASVALHHLLHHNGIDSEVVIGQYRGNHNHVWVEVPSKKKIYDITHTQYTEGKDIVITHDDDRRYHARLRGDPALKELKKWPGTQIPSTMALKPYQMVEWVNESGGVSAIHHNGIIYHGDGLDHHEVMLGMLDNGFASEEDFDNKDTKDFGYVYERNGMFTPDISKSVPPEKLVNLLTINLSKNKIHEGYNPYGHEYGNPAPTRKAVRIGNKVFPAKHPNDAHIDIIGDMSEEDQAAYEAQDNAYDRGSSKDDYPMGFYHPKKHEFYSLGQMNSYLNDHHRLKGIPVHESVDNPHYVSGVSAIHLKGKIYHGGFNKDDMIHHQDLVQAMIKNNLATEDDFESGTAQFGNYNQLDKRFGRDENMWGGYEKYHALRRQSIADENTINIRHLIDPKTRIW